MNEAAEIIDYLDRKLVSLDAYLDERFEASENRFELRMSGLESTLNTRMDSLDTRMDSVDEKLRDMLNGLDAYAKKANTYFQEMMLLTRQVDRHERWHRQAADKIGIKLER